jgi:hypothetical protein
LVALATVRFAVRAVLLTRFLMRSRTDFFARLRTAFFTDLRADFRAVMSCFSPR